MLVLLAEPPCSLYDAAFYDLLDAVQASLGNEVIDLDKGQDQVETLSLLPRRKEISRWCRTRLVWIYYQHACTAFITIIFSLSQGDEANDKWGNTYQLRHKEGTSPQGGAGSACYRHQLNVP